jgi:reactive chlorine resistance protein C
LLIGVLKFTAGEAQGIQPLVANSPVMFWLYQPSGRIEFDWSDRDCCRVANRATAFSKALFHGQHWSHHHFRADGEFSFLDTGSVPVLTRISPVGDAGQFLIKDFVLVGASIWTAAEARNAD